MTATEVRVHERYAWHGQSLLITNDRGDCADDDALTGFYFREARYLRTLRLLVNGEQPWLCETATPSPTRLEFVHVHPEVVKRGKSRGVPHRALEIRVRMEVGIAGLTVTADVINHHHGAVDFTIGWRVDADFADVTEASDGKRKQRGRVSVTKQPDAIVFRYGHSKLPYECLVRAEGREGGAADWQVRGGTRASLVTTLHLDSQEHATLELHVEPRDFVSPLTREDVDAREAVWRGWSERLVRIDTPGNSVAEAVLRSNLRDVASFPLLDGARDEWLTMQAGVPLYPALYGRDALTAGWQGAMLDRGEFLDATLTRLGRLQGTRIDNWRDEEPGRIAYQVRHGPLPRLNLNPDALDYADYASPMMFIIAMAQLYAWTGDASLVRKHWDVARRILDWAREFGDNDGDGYLEYNTRSSADPKNQGWKDSNEAIVYDDGSPVPDPIATCELQGYWFAAQQIFSILAWVVGDGDTAKAYWSSAADLKTRFNRDWWVERESFFALAMDPDKKLVHAPSSNVGQCIATGIVDDAHLPRAVQRMFAPDLYSGWAIRTLSTEHRAYNPLQYHLGSVWAVENATIVFGLRRFGFDDEALLLARSLFDLAQLYPSYRIPECVGGIARRHRPVPGAYPRTNTPQLWNATGFALLVQTLLGLQPVAALDLLVFDPALPTWLPEIVLRDLRVGGATATIRFWRDDAGDTHGEVIEKRGTLHLIKQPPPESLAPSAKDRFTALVDRVMHH